MIKFLKTLRGVIVIILFISCLQTQAQQNLTLYHMRDVSQVNYLNPAYMNECKWELGFPLLASTHINLGLTGLSYNDVFPNGKADFSSAINKAHGTDFFTSEIHLNSFRIAYRRNDWFFNFNVAEKINFNFAYPKDLLQLAWKGNVQYIGKTADFSNLGAWGMYYREYAFGAAKKVNEQWQFGAKFKILFGKATTATKVNNLYLSTDAATYNLKFQSQIDQFISFPLDFGKDADGKVNSTNSKLDIVPFLLNRKNIGASVDLGAYYKYDEKLTFSASILDLGFIRWKSDGHMLSQAGEIEYTGSGVGSGFNSIDYLKELGDSLRDMYKFTEKTSKYTSFLPSQIYTGATYEIDSKSTAGLVLRSQWLYKRPIVSAALSYNRNITKWLSGSLSYAAINGAYNNLGVGLGVKMGVFRFHIVSDQSLVGIIPHKIRNVNLRFGFTWIWGCGEKQKKKARRPGSNTSKGCYWLQNY